VTAEERLDAKIAEMEATLERWQRDLSEVRAMLVKLKWVRDCRRAEQCGEVQAVTQMQ